MNRALALALVAFLTVGVGSLHGSPQEEGVSPGGALCQLTFSGRVGEQSVSRVSISVSHLAEGEVVETSLVAQVRRGTSPGSISSLLADRLKSNGAKVTFVNHAPHTVGELFIEGVLSVRLDLPSGPEASVIFCDRPLAVLGLRPTSDPSQAGMVEFIGVVRSVDGKTRGRDGFEAPIVAGDSGHDVCKRLFDISLEAGWLPVRPSTDRWSPTRRKDSRKLESTEIKFAAQGWEIELVAG